VFFDSFARIGLLYAALTVLSVPLGLYMARVFSGESAFLDFLLEPVEQAIYRLCGIQRGQEMTWSEYAGAALLFGAVSWLLLYLMQRVQYLLPFNPQHLGGIEPLLAFNTAASFTTNTNWQAYSGESTMSYMSQMLGLTSQNFLSAATGTAISIAVIRGFVRHSAKTLGNFWVDLTRATLWVLMPLCAALTLVYVWQGIPDNLSAYTEAKTLEGATQIIAQGPVASQEAIKELGTNGGGFFNANSAHPYENPTPLTNLLEILSMLIIAAALTHTFGKLCGDRRQGWTLFAAMSLFFLAASALAVWAERSGNPKFSAMGIDQRASDRQSGGNMEGKEVRFGPIDSALFAAATTDTSCGAVNSMLDSYTPVGGLVPMFNMQLGEVIFGGVGSGLYGMIVMAVMAVFVAGLMVGRTPEYLGKKIEAREMKLVMLYVLIFPALILLPAGVASVMPAGLSSIANSGPHGFSEILYAFTQAAANNGSAFAGLNANTPFYNLLIGFVMLAGRFMMAIPALAIAGSMAEKKVVAPSAGTFPTTGITFVILLGAVILIVGALIFFAGDALGPIVEHYAMARGKLF
jgi:K+-transporting ATPase ATPase A chain